MQDMQFVYGVVDEERSDRLFLLSDLYEQYEAAKHWAWELDYRASVQLDVLKNAIQCDGNANVIEMSRRELLQAVRDLINAENEVKDLEQQLLNKSL